MDTRTLLVLVNESLWCLRDFVNIDAELLKHCPEVADIFENDAMRVVEVSV
ncbi:MAG: hypothetical protein M0R70_05195 [Nitrospirae bacterium]|nr:hypothetical protein [Nitrospirota bacterium]